MSRKINLLNIFSYLIAHIRYPIYYSLNWGWLMRSHIREQIDIRINIMDKSCYLTGSCKICGCKTTALQMANKSCDAPCYPVLMGRKRWRDFKRGLIYREKNSEYIWAYSTRKDGPKKMVRIKLADYVDKSAFRVGTD